MRRLVAVSAVIVTLGLAGTLHAQPAPFKTAAEAKAWLAANNIAVAPSSFGTLIGFDGDTVVTGVRALLMAGVSPNLPTLEGRLYPLTLVARSCQGENAVVIAEALLAAGADPTRKEKIDGNITPLMEFVACPGVMLAALRTKPDLNATDDKGWTVAHHALNTSDPPPAATLSALVASGFDIPRWRASLDKHFPEAQSKALLDAMTASAALHSLVPDSAPAPAIDWEATGPFPARSSAEAAKLLARPGADTTVDDHLIDAVQRLQPQRMALALAAGANVDRRGTGGNTPLMELADRCTQTSRVDRQVAIARQLITAGANAQAVNDLKENALSLAADACPIEVVRMLIAAGASPTAVSANRTTALFAAINASRVDVIDALLEAGVDPKKEPYDVGKFSAGNKPVQDALKRKRR